jgi:multiple sugar transport system substrate-binding protein
MIVGKKTLVLVLLLALFFLFGVTNGFCEGKTPEKVSLTVWVSVSSLMPIFESAILGFQKDYPGAEVEAVAFPLREAEKKFALAMSSGTMPDVFMLSQGFNFRYIKDEDPAPPDVVDLVNNKMNAVFSDAVTVDGKVYGVPILNGYILHYWNKQHFREAGLTRAPKNWDELIEYSKKLAKYDADGTLTRSGISLRLSDESGAADKFSTFLRQAGGFLFERKPNGKYHNDYDNDAGRDALKLYVDLLWKYKVNSPAMQGDYMAFTEGSASQFQRGPFVISYLATHAPDLEYEVAELPRYKAEGSAGYMYALWVPKTTPNKRAAWDYIKTFVGQEYAVKQMKETGWPTCRNDLDLSSVYTEFPQYKAYVDTATKPGYVNMYKPFGPSDEVFTKFGQMLSKGWLDPSLVDNPAGIAKVISDAAAETDAIFKREGLYEK